MTVVIILGILFLALIVLVPLLEKAKGTFKEEDVAKWSRWIYPLVMILLIVQFLRYMFQ